MKIFCIFFRKYLVNSKKSSNFASFFAYLPSIPPRAIGAHISLPAANPPSPQSVLPSDWEERPPPRRAISIEPRFAAFRALCAHISRRMAYLYLRANTRPHIASLDPARMTITKQSIIGL